MNFKSCIAAAALAVLPMVSQASYLYTWVPTNPEAPRQISFSIEFENRVVDSGSYSLQLNQFDFRDGFPRPEFDLIAFDLSWANGGYELSHFHRDDRFQAHVSLNMSFTFGEDGALAGYIQSNGFITGFTIAGNQSSGFQVTDLRSDAFMENYGCNGGSPATCIPITGVFEQTELPEPGTLALFGVGLLAASRMSRRKTK